MAPMPTPRICASAMKCTAPTCQRRCWLNPPASYDGGELVGASGHRPVVIKGEPGSVVVYPSTQLHEVTPVRRGQRLVSITFIESLIPDEFLAYPALRAFARWRRWKA